MKQRLLIMNGSRIVQSEQEGQWRNEKVDKAGALKPGIYNLYLARPADKTATCTGMIVHVDKDGVFQQTGKTYVVHARADFDKAPEIGSLMRIGYDARGRASLAAETVQLSRGRSRLL
ncbi:MAG: conjugal transfer protein TraO [Proteobacteria bacterium]|nr:conjugal transfer protein TraO [Pseudomonadota bacterium]